MKVYLVHNEYYDHEEYTNGSVLLGIFSSMERAIEGREKSIASDLEECTNMGTTTSTSMDSDNNPIISIFSDGKLSAEYVFTIEEWTVK